MAAPEEEQEFRLGWSLWRRAHQAVAKRCHTTSRKAKRELLREQRPDLTQPTPARATPFFSTPMAARLTDEQWERLRPLMCRHRSLPLDGPDGTTARCARRDAFWIFGTGASWRDLPEEEFGSWRTVYGRYRKWRKEGLWRRIVEALQFGHDVADS
jgi:transposase